MAFTGGDLIEVLISNPVGGEVRLEPKGTEDIELSVGGIMVNDDDAQVTGAGTNIKQMNRVRWYVNVPPCGWDSTDDTLINLQNIRSAAPESTMTFTFIDGAVYKGTGNIVGDLIGNKNTATINGFKVSGGGQLERLA